MKPATVSDTHHASKDCLVRDCLVIDKRLDLFALNPHSVLFVGGARSGKSSFALNYAQKRTKKTDKKAFIATMQKFADTETEKRIRNHQAERENAQDMNWLTIEEAFDLQQAMELAKNQHCSIILIDCITLWLSNLLLAEKDEEEILAEVENLAFAIKNSPIPVLMVSNEVGMGIVPLYASARLFRDIQGKANQILAGICEAVVSFTCGIPLLLKG